MKIPKGFNDAPNNVCKLKKALYGLKQSPSCWNVTFTKFLNEQGLIQSKVDQCIFMNEKRTIILGIVVDDALLIFKNEKTISPLIKGLENRFKMTFEFDPKSYIGLTLERNSFGLKVSQPLYTRNLIRDYGFIDAKRVITPMVPTCSGSDIEKSKEGQTVNFPYRQAVGTLLFLSNKSRPDISYAVSHASRYLENPTNENVIAVKRIIRYLKATPNDGIYFSKVDSEPQMNAYCDADYAGDPETRRSTSEMVIFLNKSPIMWSSRRQPIVTLSSTEAEYVSACDCVKEVIYLKSLIKELTDKEISVRLYEDNQSTIKLIKNGVMNKRSKHIDVRYKITHEKLRENVFKLCYCPSNLQIADILTKPLGSESFNFLKNFVMGH